MKLNTDLALNFTQAWLNEHIIGHWKFDEESVGEVADASGHELHGRVKLATVSLGKFGRALHSDGKNVIFEVPNNSLPHFGKGSFSFAAWNRIEDYTYPLTKMAISQGYGCFFSKDNKLVTPGWEIGHGHIKDKTEVCIRDKKHKFGRKYILHDAEFTDSKTLNQWTHYAVVFDRKKGKVYLYINGKKQRDYLEISQVTGTVDNDKPLGFGYVHGWKVKGAIDDYRLYNGALDDTQVALIYKDHTVQ